MGMVGEFDAQRFSFPVAAESRILGFQPFRKLETYPTALYIDLRENREVDLHILREAEIKTLRIDFFYRPGTPSTEWHSSVTVVVGPCGVDDT